MAQIFHPSTNTLARVSLFGAIFFVAGSLVLLTEFNRSSYSRETFAARNQPVPFSHKHHVSGLGLDCRHCHTTVEQGAFAGIPATKTCMTCHSQVWSTAPMLEPVRESFRTDRSIEWNRVHDLPDFVYFNHSIHVKKGMGCSTCHGRVDRMPLIWKTQTLQMEWCLDCHRHPERNVRPRAEIFNMNWEPPANQLEVGAQLVAEYGIRKNDDCSACHR